MVFNSEYNLEHMYNIPNAQGRLEFLNYAFGKTILDEREQDLFKNAIYRDEIGADIIDDLAGNYNELLLMIMGTAEKVAQAQTSPEKISSARRATLCAMFEATAKLLFIDLMQDMYECTEITGEDRPLTDWQKRAFVLHMRHEAVLDIVKKKTALLNSILRRAAADYHKHVFSKV